MRITKRIIILLFFINISSLVVFPFISSASGNQNLYVYRGRVYFFLPGKNSKSCFDCHTTSGIKKNDYPVVVGKEIEFENINDHINEFTGNLKKDEKENLLFFIEKLSTKAIEKNVAKVPSKKNDVLDNKTRERLLSLGYLSNPNDSYSEPTIKINKSEEFSAIELLKFSSIGFKKVRDELSDIGFSITSRGDLVKAIVLPVVDFGLNNFHLTIIYCNLASDSYAKIEIFDYFSGNKIDSEILNLQKSKNALENSVIFTKKYRKVIISIRFFESENLRILGLKLLKSE